MKEEKEQEELEELEEQKAENEQIEKNGTVVVEKNEKLVQCINIIGQIEGHYILPDQNKSTKYEHLIPQLVSIEQDEEIKGVLIILNTVGGDVEAGLAIAELIAGMSKPTVSIVLGGGHSIGVPLAVSANYSFIVPSATMTIHPVRMNGLVLGVPQTLSYFQEMQARITKFVIEHSKIEEEKFTNLMMETGKIMSDVGTVIDGGKAVEYGLIDEIGSLKEALETLEKLMEKDKEEGAKKAKKQDC